MTITTHQINTAEAGRLHRSTDDRVLGGVAAGLADHLGLDVAAVRVGMVALSLLGGVAIPIYLAGWLLIPAEGAASTIADDWLFDGPICGPGGRNPDGVASPPGDSPSREDPIDDASGNDAAKEWTAWS